VTHQDTSVPRGNRAAEQLRQDIANERTVYVEDLYAALRAERLAVVEEITTLLCTCGSGRHRKTWAWCRLHGVDLDEVGVAGLTGEGNDGG
jgi:hypothetical protein